MFLVIYSIPNHCLCMCSLAALSFELFWRVAFLWCWYRISKVLNWIWYKWIHCKSHIIVVTQFHSLKRYHPRLTIFNAWYRIFIPTHDQLLCYWWQKKIFLCPRWQFFSIQFLSKWERIGNFMKKGIYIIQQKRHFYIMFLWHL